MKICTVTQSRSVPCSIKFLREFNFADWQFFGFTGTIFCDWEELVFLAGN